MNRFSRAFLLAAIVGVPSLAHGQSAVNVAAVDSSGTAVVDTRTGGGFIQALPQPSYAAPSYGYPGGTYGSPQPAQQAPQQNAPNTQLTFPPDNNPKPNWSSSGSSGGGSSGSATGSSSSAPAAPTRTGVEDAGLPAPATTPTAAKPEKKNYLEGHVVLFLRAPGDEDPSPKGILGRFSREAKIVKRLAAEVAKGNKPATRPEDAVLRDPAPQGFYLPDEVDAWLVTADGTLYVLASENGNFDKIAALALSASLNVAGPASDLVLEPAVGTVQKVKVLGVSIDGTEPKIEAPPIPKKLGSGD